MDKKLKYDPEDIESLLKHKSFDQLYLEEKEYVLRHLESKEEYEDMRLALNNINRYKEPDILPPPSIKSNLLRKFETAPEPKFQWLYSLNSLFVIKPVYRNPVFQFSMVVMLVVVSFLSIKLITKENNPVIVENKNTPIELNKENNNSRKPTENEPVVQDDEVKNEMSKEQTIAINSNTNENKNFELDKEVTYEEEMKLLSESPTKDLINNEHVMENEKPASYSFDYGDGNLSKTVESTVRDKKTNIPKTETNVESVAAISRRGSFKSKEIKNPVTNQNLTRSLAEDEEMIDFLFTAL